MQIETNYTLVLLLFVLIVGFFLNEYPIFRLFQFSSQIYKILTLPIFLLDLKGRCTL